MKFSGKNYNSGLSIDVCFSGGKGKEEKFYCYLPQRFVRKDDQKSIDVDIDFDELEWKEDCGPAYRQLRFQSVYCGRHQFLDEKEKWRSFDLEIDLVDVGVFGGISCGERYIAAVKYVFFRKSLDPLFQGKWLGLTNRSLNNGNYFLEFNVERSVNPERGFCLIVDGTLLLIVSVKYIEQEYWSAKKIDDFLREVISGLISTVKLDSANAIRIDLSTYVDERLRLSDWRFLSVSRYELERKLLSERRISKDHCSYEFTEADLASNYVRIDLDECFFDECFFDESDDELVDDGLIDGENKKSRNWFCRDLVCSDLDWKKIKGSLNVPPTIPDLGVVESEIIQQFIQNTEILRSSIDAFFVEN